MAPKTASTRSESSTGSAEPSWLALLRALASGSWISGEALAGELGVTRAAVWKQVRALEDRGIAVERIRGRGYRLAEPVALLDPEPIRAALAVADLAADITILAEVDSTNRWLRDAARRGARGPALCLAEHQTAGRGRRGRSWAAAAARNLTLSALWRFEAGPADLAGLSLAIGVAVAEALAAFDLDVGLKWPNDLLIEDAKLGGILIEVDGEVGGPTDVVLGLGLNLAQPPDPAIDQAWTDARAQLGRALPRADLAAMVGTACLLACRRFASSGLAPFLPGWRSRDALAGRAVRVDGAEGVLEGEASGIDRAGRLLVRSAGAIVTIHAGDISVRPSGGPA